MNQSGSKEKWENPYYLAFDLLLAKLLAAEQALNVSEAAFGYANESPEKWLERIPDGRLCGMLADICDDSIPGYVKHVPSLRGPDEEIDFLLRAVRDFRTQSYLWAIARAFEAFREFVGAAAGELATASESERRGSSGKNGPAESKTRRFSDALKHVRKTVPVLKGYEMRNVRGIDLAQWIRVVSTVRDAVAHNEGIVGSANYEKYRSSGLEKEFPGELEDAIGYVLKPTHDVALNAITRLREYGLVIYKAVSETANLPVLIYNHEKGITTWRR